MSDLFARAMSKGDPHEEAEKAIGWMKSTLPYLHDVLAGCRPTPTTPARLPGSVRLFSNGGELKAEVTGAEWVMRGYLLIPHGILTVEAIEGELAAGRIGWSAKTERLNSKTGLPY